MTYRAGLLLALLALAGPALADEDFVRCGAMAQRVPDQALEHCDRALKSGLLLPQEASIAHRNRAVAWRTKSDVDHALADLDEAIRLDPTNADAYVMRGVAWRHKQDDGRALQDFESALRLHPDPAALGARGDLYRRHGDLEKAIADYSEAIKLAPERSLGYRVRGAARLQHAEYALAADDYAEALRREPTMPTGHRMVGIVRYAAAQYDRSASELDLAVGEETRDAQALLWRYLAQRRAGLLEAAEAHLVRDAPRAAPKDPRDWPAPLLDLYLGRVSLADIQAVAVEGDEKQRSARRCELDFFAGELLLVQGQPAAGLPLVQSAATACQAESFHAIAARAELLRNGLGR